MTPHLENAQQTPPMVAPFETLRTPAWADLVNAPEVGNEAAVVEAPSEATSAEDGTLIKAFKIGLIVNEALPTDDVVRYGLLVAAQGYTHNPAAGAAILGLSTFATEGAAVLASAKWIAEDKIRPAVDTVRERIDSFKETLNRLLPRVRPGRLIPNVPKDSEVGRSLSAPVQAAIALNLGNVVLLEAKQRMDNSRTAEKNRKDGLIGAGMVAGYLAVEGALISTGVGNLTNPAYLTGVAVGVAGMQYGVYRLQKRLRKEKS